MQASAASSSSNTLNSKTNELSLNPLAAAAADVATSLGDQMPSTSQPDGVQTNSTTAAEQSTHSSSQQHENNVNSSNTTNPLLQSLSPLQKDKPASGHSADTTASAASPPNTAEPTSTTQQDAPATASSASNATATATTTTSPPALPTPAESLTRLLTNSVVEVMEALETLLIYTKNLLLYPDEKKYRKIKMTNIHYQERLGR